MKQYAVFDIDGTLIRWQLYHTVVDKLAKQGALGESAHQQLHDARMRWKRREDSEAFKVYEETLIGLFEAVLPAIDVVKFDALVAEVIEEYKDQVYTYTRDLIQELKSKGYFLLAISGSHNELVEQIANYYGFDDFVGTQYSRGDTGFNGHVTIGSHNKQAALKRLIKKHDLREEGSYAIGDSLSDAEMLEVVANPIAFNPDRRLYDIAVQRQWPIVVERKNVIYRILPKEGEYTLKVA